MAMSCLIAAVGSSARRPAQLRAATDAGHEAATGNNRMTVKRIVTNIATDRIEAAETFYGEVLGMRATRSAASSTSWRIPERRRGRHATLIGSSITFGTPLAIPASTAPAISAARSTRRPATPIEVAIAMKSIGGSVISIAM